MQREIEQYTADRNLPAAVLVSSKSGQGMQDAVDAIFKVLACIAVPFIVFT
jgi:hypothetical protein